MSFDSDEFRSVYVQPDGASMIRDMLKEFCITHGIQARIKSMHVVHDPDTRFPTELQIDITYSPIPYCTEEENATIERELEKEFQLNAHALAVVPLHVYIRAESSEDETDDSD